MRAHICVICSGAGSFQAGNLVEVCSACSGKGWLEVRAGYHPQVCPVCSGEGKVYRDGELEDCHGCAGGGWVEVRAGSHHRQDISQFTQNHFSDFLDKLFDGEGGVDEAQQDV